MTSPTAVTALAIGAMLRRHRYRYRDEIALQDGIADVLGNAGIAFEREVQLTRADKIDFLAGALGIEVKVAGQAAAVTRQLTRYAASDRIGELILVTTRARHHAVPASIKDVPVAVVWLSAVTR